MALGPPPGDDDLGENGVTVTGARAAGRLWQALSGAWGAFVAVIPHVLHHVGPLTGAALLAGLGGRVLFFFVGLAAAIPVLRRLYRRFRTWIAPGVAVAVFAAAYSFSTVVIGPLVAAAIGAGSEATDGPNSAISGAWNPAVPYTNIGEVYRTLGDYERASQFFKQALEVDRNSLSAYNSLGHLQLEQVGRMQQEKGEQEEKERQRLIAQARQIFQDVLELAPRSIFASVE